MGSQTREKYGKFVRIIYAVCGAAGFVSFLAYFVKQLFRSEGPVPLAVAAAGCVITGAPLFTGKFFARTLNCRLFKILENIYAWGMAVFTVTFISLSAYILTAGNTRPPARELPGDAVFAVFGAKLNGDEPGTVLEQRLVLTAEYLTEMPESVCVVTGGQGDDEVCPEAYVMRDRLEQLGIDGGRIITEDRARDTADNIKFTEELLKEEGLAERPEIIVSSAFHIPRIKLMCGRLGVESDYLSAPNPPAYIIFPVLVREYISYVKLLIFGV